MANIPVKSIKFPGLDDTYTFVQDDPTLSVPGAAADAAKVGELKSAVAQKANTDGSYANMTAGNAEQLVSAVFIEDSTPYKYRTSGGTADIGDREYDEIVGGTVAWNQQIAIASASKTTTKSGITFTDNRDGTYSIQTEAGGATETAYLTVDSNQLNGAGSHVVVCIGAPNGSAQNTYKLIEAWAAGNIYNSGKVFKLNSEGRFEIRISITGGTVISSPVKFSPQLFDLTQMFGSTIADYIYSLETATPGAGVAWFRKLFPADYYDYNSGELISVAGLQSHDMTGFNQWDEEWEAYNTTQIKSKYRIRVIPGATYYAKCASSGLALYYYATADSASNGSGYANNNTFTVPSTANYMMLYTASGYGTTYKNDICINLSWDGERDGEYEPYVKHSYPLDSTLTLRGIPKLDSNNELYYDGDVYQSDGTVMRKYQQRAYQSGDENLADAITDGTNTVVKLSTPTTETADAFQAPQIVDDFGTEEYISTTIVPVGHNTKYANNLRAKLEMAPNSPDGDGDYIVRQSNGQNTYVPLLFPASDIPAAPTTDGNYTLKCTVASGTATYTWEAQA